jgi:NADH-quinone oxidoreductase subunit C
MVDDVPVAERLRERFAHALQEVSEAHGEVTLVVNCEQIVEICRWLKNDPDCRYDLLADMAGVDYLGREPRFEVVYQLYSVPYNRRLRLKVRVAESEAVVPSVSSVWSTANWHEREAFDMLGIRFADHPDLRRIYMPDDYPGHPLRKDFPALGPDVEVHPRDNVRSLEQPPPPFVSKLWRKGDIRGKSQSQG